MPFIQGKQYKLKKRYNPEIGYVPHYFNYDMKEAWKLNPIQSAYNIIGQNDDGYSVVSFSHTKGEWLYVADDFDPVNLSLKEMIK